jgi:hypothetical protein
MAITLSKRGGNRMVLTVVILREEGELSDMMFVPIQYHNLSRGVPSVSG